MELINLKELISNEYETEDYKFGELPTVEDIQIAETLLNINFPENFREFVSQVGLLELDNSYFFGIPRGLTDEGNVVRMTQFARTEWGLPKKYIVIYSSERSEEHTSELQSRQYLVCRLLLEKKKSQSFL